MWTQLIPAITPWFWAEQKYQFRLHIALTVRQTEPATAAETLHVPTDIITAWDINKLHGQLPIFVLPAPTGARPVLPMTALPPYAQPAKADML